MHLYRKKPVVIEAFQMTAARHLSKREWPSWLHEAWNQPRDCPGALQAVSTYDTRFGSPFEIVTLEGNHQVSEDDWIIRGVKGELYPCKPDIFEATYEDAVGCAEPVRPADTFGERAVGLAFNPGNNPAVDECKRLFASVIDAQHKVREASSDPEAKRLASVAITEAQTAQMWAVKSLTWKPGA